MSKETIKKDQVEFSFSIREFQKNQTDAQMLADCYNSWDDPESWPGGFGHSDPFTGERLLEELEKTSPLSKFVAIADGKIVGHCDVISHFNEEDTVYVGLLGVDPNYQGRKIGKTLLIHATFRALELGKDIITLHTWGGNLKAMPLYKKTGYFWAPESSVYMENYLPGILRRKLFKKYTEKFSWYETFKRSLDLVPDVELIDEMSVYNYCFEEDENNSLKVIIDTKAKKIAGFELKTPEGKIGINCLIKNSVGYVSFGKVPVSWTFLNETKNDILFTLKANCLNGIKFETEPERQITVKSGETTAIHAFAILDDTVTPLANPKESQTRVKPRIESYIHFNEDEIDLAVGLAPVDPLEIELYPHLRSIIPGEKSTINLRVWNRTSSKIKGSVVISENPNISFDSNKVPILLNANERKDIDLNFTALENISEKKISLKLNAFIDEKDGSVKLPEETIYLPVIDPLGLELNCSGYYLKNKYAILENNNLRLKFTLEDAYLFHSITDKRNNQVFKIRTSLLDLGMPFTGWGSELGRLSQEVKIIQGIGKATLELLVKSKAKDGIHIKRSFTLRTNSDLIEVSVKAVNASNQTFKNIAVRVLYDGWGPIDTEGTTYFPLSKGILRSSNSLVFKSARHFPDNPQDFIENWISTELSNNQLLGFIWHKEYVTKIETRVVTIPQLEFQFGDIAPGESKEGKYHIFMGRGSWTDIRKIWKDTIEKESSTKISTNKQKHKIIDELSVEVESDMFGKCNYFNILPLNFDDTLKLTIHNNTRRKIKGKIHICLPKGLTFENGLHLYEDEVADISEKQPYLCTKKILAQETSIGRIHSVDVKVILLDMSINIPFLVQILNKDQKVKLDKQQTDEGKELVEISNGKIIFKASKDHFGSIVSFELPSIVKKNNLLSSWPNVKPFLWDSDWMGGIVPIISNPSGWGSITHLEKFEFELLTKGNEKGIRFYSNLNLKERYHGLRLEVDYTTLPQSNILKATFRLINNSEAHLWFRGGLDSNLAVSERVDNDMFFIQNNQLIKHNYFNEIWLQKQKDKWVVFVDRESKLALAIVGPDRDDIHLNISDDGELSNSVNSISEIMIPPKKTIEYNLLFILYPLNHELIDILRKHHL